MVSSYDDKKAALLQRDEGGHERQLWARYLQEENSERLRRRRLDREELPAAGAGEQEQTLTEGARDSPERHAELLVEAPRAPLSHPYIDRLKYLEMEGADDVKHKEFGGEEPAKIALRRRRSSA